MQIYQYNGREPVTRNPDAKNIKSILVIFYSLN